MLNISIEAFKKTMIGKKVSVVGIGISNLPALEFLNKCGAIITACDKRNECDMDEEILEKVNSLCEYTHFGEDYLDHFDGQDIILKAPGVNPALKQIAKARQDGIEITSEMEIFMSLCPCKMIAVTGSDGKTTTTTLIYRILNEAGHTCHIGGNIGKPLLNEVENMHPEDFVILELSSFQLMNIKVSPHVAVITNISPNHLDYHKDMSEYVEAKSQIFRHQNEGGRLIINKDNAITAAFYGKQNGKAEFFSRRYQECEAHIDDGYICYKGEKIVRISDIKIKGDHNVENYLAAVAATMEFADKRCVEIVAKNFGGVEHRMEYVRTLNGIKFYNDSIGSSPARTIAGLKAHTGDVVLIAGGRDKNLNYDELGLIIREKVSALVLIGETSQKIHDSVQKAFGGNIPIPVYFQDKYPQAVMGAFALAKGLKKDDNEVSVILSPASTSFDMFKNFEERGNKYKEIVNSLT